MIEEIEVIRGSGNIFRDLNEPNADIEQLKSILAARIIGILDEHGLSTRQAEAQTGIAYSDFSRIRRAKLDRFTIDRLMTILNRFHQDVEIQVKIKPSAPSVDVETGPNYQPSL